MTGGKEKKLNGTEDRKWKKRKGKVRELRR